MRRAISSMKAAVSISLIPPVSRAAYEYVYAQELPAEEENVSSTSWNVSLDAPPNEDLFNSGISYLICINGSYRSD